VSRHYILATAGHVDHGKSALVTALTGTNPDRLPEEIARGITIDLGFAHLDLPLAGAADPAGYRLGIVDVPGHEDFVKNMVAGVGAIDLALLVVAADDGWMPQTEEHLQILCYLGVKNAVVALTKADLASGREAVLEIAIRERLRGTPFADAPVVPTSSATGHGMDQLKRTLAQALGRTPAPADKGKPRLAVDRAFSVRGIGTVVTGSLTGGCLREGQTIAVQPLGLTGRIRGIQSHHAEVAFAGPGTRTALHLADVAVARGSTRSETGMDGVRRGDVVTLPGLGPPTRVVDVWLWRSARQMPGTRPARVMCDGAVARIHHGTGHGIARVELLEQRELPPGGAGLARLHFQTPISALIEDRFVIRDGPGQTTLAGGMVVALEDGGKRSRAESRIRFLKQCVAAAGCAEARMVAELTDCGVMPREGLLENSAFSAAEIEDAVRRRVGNGEAIAGPEFIADGGWWRMLRERARSAIEAFHRGHPERSGLPLTELRSILGLDRTAEGVLELLLEELIRDGHCRTGGLIRRRDHRPNVPPELEAAIDQIRGALNAKPFDPPSRGQLAPGAASRQALRFLVEAGEAIEVSPDLVIRAGALRQMTARIQSYLGAHRSGTVSELRQAVGTSRRVMVPLLEWLDRRGVTVRQGDRRLRGGSSLPDADGGCVAGG
jgi:selenocysteine-specific elongation factor